MPKDYGQKLKGKQLADLDRVPAAEVAALELPAGFPRDAEALALDLDGTIVGADKTLRPRTRDGAARARATPGSTS